MKEARITFTELQDGYWDGLSVRLHLREHGIDPNGVLIKDVSYEDNAVIYRQPETEDDYKDLGIF